MPLKPAVFLFSNDLIRHDFEEKKNKQVFVYIGKFSYFCSRQSQAGPVVQWIEWKFPKL